MEEASKGKAITVLRWIVFLPAAAVASMLGWFAVNILGRFSLSYVGVAADSFLGQLYFTTAGGAAMTAAFVFGGLWVAPLKNRQLAYVLSAVWLVFNVFALYAGIRMNYGWAIWQGIWSVVVVVVMCAMIYQGKFEV